MKIVGPKYQGWWRIAKMAKGDYMICDLWYIKYVPEGGKVFVSEKLGTNSIETNLYGIDTLIATDIMIDGISIEQEHRHDIIKIGVTGRYEGRRITIPLFMPEANLPLTYELLEKAGFNVVSLGDLWRSTLMTSRKPYAGEEALISEIQYHMEELMKASVALASIRRESAREIADVDREIEMIRQEPLVEYVEMQPYRLTVYTKPIAVSDGVYRWVNSYEIVINIYNTSEPEISVTSELEVRGVCHPHILNGKICSNILDRIVLEAMNGRLHNAVIMILKILQSYDPAGHPYMTIPHLVEYAKQVGAIGE
jgi:hypothetical protein